MTPTMIFVNSGVFSKSSTDTTISFRENDWLPAASISYDITRSLKVRTSYGKTITRPDFRERSNFRYTDIWSQYIVVGLDKGLKNVYCKNYDLRLEWYPGAGEIVSIGAFYKYFDSSIEMIGRGDQDQSSYRVFYINANYAKTKGIEVNLRKNLGFITPVLQKLYVSGNATWLEGEVALKTQRISGWTIRGENRPRPPLGMSPFMANAGISWQDKWFGSAINYNYTARKLVLGGVIAELDEYEARRGSLEAQLKLVLAKEKVELNINASNLLDEPYIRYINKCPNEVDPEEEEQAVKDLKYNGVETIRKKVWKGRSYSMSITYKF
jgi:outer membrane receptor protein involved in Fe transport